jgi:hypothetical protein
MKTSEYIRGQILTVIVAALSGLFAFVASKVAGEVLDPFFEHIVPSVSKSTLCWIILLLFLLALVSVAYAISFHFEAGKPLHEKYNYDPITAISTHKKTGRMVCSRCLLTGIEVPLVKVGASAWKCLNTACGSGYDPNRKFP